MSTGARPLESDRRNQGHRWGAGLRWRSSPRWGLAALAIILLALPLAAVVAGRHFEAGPRAAAADVAPPSNGAAEATTVPSDSDSTQPPASEAQSAPAVSASAPELAPPGADSPAGLAPSPSQLDAAVSPNTGDRELTAAPPAAPTGGAEPFHVGIQAGHWKAAEHAPELAALRTSTGAVVDGVEEWRVNLDIAQRVVAKLTALGVAADLLPASVPPHYQADAFVALHGDSNPKNPQLSGYKLARASESAIPETDDALLAAISRQFALATGLKVDSLVTDRMTSYYAFNNRRYEHAVAPGTPAVILEMGFLTNSADRQLLTNEPDRVAAGIAQGIEDFLERR